MLPIIMMGILVYNSAENIRRAVCFLVLMHWSERVCLVDRDHQLGFVGMVREDPLEAVSHFHVGSKEKRCEIRWNTALSLWFCYRAYYLAGDSAIRAGVFTRKGEPHKLIGGFINVGVCGVIDRFINVRHRSLGCFTRVLAEDMEEISMNLEKIVNQRQAAGKFKHTLVYLSETLRKKVALAVDLGGWLISHIWWTQYMVSALAVRVA